MHNPGGNPIARCIVFGALALLAGCGGSGSSAPIPSATATPNAKATATPTAKPTATPTVAPTATPVAQRLYAAGPSEASVYYYSSPFVAASTPAGSFAYPPTINVVGLAVDSSGDVIFADETSESLFSYSRPNPTSAEQFSVATTFEPAGMAYSANGALYIADYTGTVQTTSTLSASSVFTAAIATGLDDPEDVCFDAAGNLYVANNGNGKINAYAPPSFAAAPTVASTGGSNITRCAYDSVTNQLAVAQSGPGASGSVMLYNLPLTASSTPAATLSFTAISPNAIASDSVGNLYVSVGGPENAIQVYKPPFATATNPTALFQFSTPVVSGNAQPMEQLSFGT